MYQDLEEPCEESRRLLEAKTRRLLGDGVSGLRL